MKTNVMAHLIKFILIVFIFSSCTSYISAVEDDDVYSGGKKQIPVHNTHSKKVEKEYAPASSYDYEEEQSQLPENRDYSQIQEHYRNQGQNQEEVVVQNSEQNQDAVSNQEYSSDDYYDYAYAARIKRFYGGTSDSYYADYYTNLYWYTYDPFYWGTSIYLGYNWWYPSYSYYRPGWYCGFGFGYPSLYVGFGWSGYYGGYHHGYWDGYYDGYWGSHFYNPYDHNSTTHHYYGPRTGGGNSSGTERARREAPNGTNNSNSGTKNTARRSFPEVYESSLSASSTATGARRDPSVSGRTSTVGGNSTSVRSDLSTSVKSSVSTTATRSDLSTPSGIIKQSSERIETNRRVVNESAYRSTATMSTPRSIQTERSTQGARQVTPNDRAGAIGQSRYGSTSNESSRSSSQVRKYESPTYPSTKQSSGYTSPQYNKERGRSTAVSSPDRSSSSMSTPSRYSTSTPDRSSSVSTPSRSSSASTPSRSSSASTPSRSSSVSAPSRSSSVSTPRSSSSSSRSRR